MLQSRLQAFEHDLQNINKKALMVKSESLKKLVDVIEKL